MTRDKAESLLTAEDIAAAREHGKEWGAMEYEVWCDQHENEDAPGWTMGTYAGPLPFARDDERAEAYETILDFAAMNAWEAADYSRLCGS